MGSEHFSGSKSSKEHQKKQKDDSIDKVKFSDEENDEEHSESQFQKKNQIKKRPGGLKLKFGASKKSVNSEVIFEEDEDCVFEDESVKGDLRANPFISVPQDKKMSGFNFADFTGRFLPKKSFSNPEGQNYSKEI